MILKVGGGGGGARQRKWEERLLSPLIAALKLFASQKVEGAYPWSPSGFGPVLLEIII